MPDYVPLPIKYRPKTFDDLVGQKHNSVVLKNIVQKGDIWPSYIFSGSRGTGKTSSARILARAINCLDNQQGNPCGVCITCVAILENRAIDVIEMDAASHGNVDDVRELRKQAMYSTNDMDYRVFILDEAHMMSREAFNAMLKILEEPPPNTLFIFATTEPGKIPDTILSRSMPFTFRRIRSSDLLDRLKFIASEESIDYDEEALGLIARYSLGGMRDAISTLEQMTKVSDKVNLKDVEQFLGIVGTEVYVRMLQALLEQDVKGALVILEDVANNSSELAPFIRGFIDLSLDMLVLINDVRPDRTDSEMRSMSSLLQKISETDLLQIEKVLSDTLEKMRFTSFSPRSSAEIAVLKINHVLNGVRKSKTERPPLPDFEPQKPVQTSQPQKLTVEMAKSVFGVSDS